MSLKRERSYSTNNILSSELASSANDRSSVHVLPILEPVHGESKSHFYQRLLRHIDTSMFKPATEFCEDGIYLYKRPVRSSNNQEVLLAQAGTVFQHCVVYVKMGGKLVSLEYGPANAMDITANFMEEANAGPILNSRPSMPERECLPMMHIASGHHSLEAFHVQQALQFAEARPYHALRNNCIAFADFAVRVLTGSTIKSAPLVFDIVAGKVPPQDSPLLAFLFMATQMTWFAICDGSRLMADFLKHHPSPPPLPPAPGSGLSLSSNNHMGRSPERELIPGSERIAAAAAAAAAEAEEAAAAAATRLATTASPWQQQQPVAALRVSTAAGSTLRASNVADKEACNLDNGSHSTQVYSADSGVSEATGLGRRSHLQSIPSVTSLLHRASSTGSSKGSMPGSSGKPFDPLGQATKRRMARKG